MTFPYSAISGLGGLASALQQQQQLALPALHHRDLLRAQQQHLDLSQQLRESLEKVIPKEKNWADKEIERLKEEYLCENG